MGWSQCKHGTGASLRIPFFASEDRVHKLSSPKLRAILDAVLFEPGRHLPLDATGVEVGWGVASVAIAREPV